MTVMAVVAAMANVMGSNANMDVGRKRPLLYFCHTLMVPYFFNGKNNFNRCNECNDFNKFIAA